MSEKQKICERCLFPNKPTSYDCAYCGWEFGFEGGGSCEEKRKIENQEKRHETDARSTTDKA